MTPDTHRIEQLEGLLATIQRNAAILAEQRATSGPEPLAPAEASPAEFEEAPAPSVSAEVHTLDEDLLMTIPPGAPDEEIPLSVEPEAIAAPAPPGVVVSEPPAAAASEPPSATASEPPAVAPPSMPPSVEDAPPISTQQQRGDDQEEAEGSLEASLGFSSERPSQAPDTVAQSEEDEEDFAASAPRTPPPESGPQITIPPKEAADSLMPGEQPMPTMEQLGSTIDLDGDGSGAEDLELAVGQDEPELVSDDSYEAELPQTEFAGGYDASLRAPDDAAEELEAHDNAERERAERHSLAPSSAGAAVPPPAESEARPIEAEIVARPAVDVTAPAALYDRVAPKASLNTFLERLDASLQLGAAQD